MILQDEIKKIVKGDVDASEERLTKYSHDASLLEVKPAVVVWPKDKEDVKAIVKWVAENKGKEGWKDANLSITARAAGTCMSGGAIGESIILDFTKYMNVIGKVEHVSAFSMTPKFPNAKPVEISGTATVMPGCYYRDFEKATLAQDLILPCFTASKSINAMGGMFGNNSAGERTLMYGKTEDYVLESKIVFADGYEYTVKPLNKKELYAKIAQGDFEGEMYKNIFALINEHKEEIKNAKPQVSKNSAGYYLWNIVNPEYLEGTGDLEIFDLNKLLVGSQGTLGIMVEMKLGLVKPKNATNLVVVFMRDTALLPQLVNKILPHNPQTIETYDDKTFMIVLKYIVSFAKLLGVGNFIRLIFSFGPEVMMTLRHGFPRMIFLIEFTADTQKEANTITKNAIKDLEQIKGIGIHRTKNEFEAKKYWTIRREAFNLIRFHLKKMKSEAFVDDVIVRPEMLPQFFPALYSILEEYKSHMTFAVGGHAGNGNMHIYTLLDPHDPKLTDIVVDVSNRVYDLVIKLKGSITAEHNDGFIRTPFLSKMYGENIIALFQQTKNIFDSQNFLNPGKKVPTQKQGGTMEYIKEHIPHK